MNKTDKKFLRTKLSTSIALITGSMMLSPVVMAAEEEAQTDSKGFQIETIVVTSQKRVQSLQDVPITIATVGEEEIANAGVSSISDIKTLIPSLNVFSASSPVQSSITIRGAGTGAADPTLEPSVGVFIDGVFMPRSVFGLTDLVDVNRIEVLMGPQGTLYGKNTNAGVISVMTKGAPEEFEGQAEFTAGNFGTTDFKGSVGFELNDDMSARLGLITRSRDGFIDSAENGEEYYNDVDKQAFRGQFFWDVNEDISVRAIGYSSSSEGSAGVAENYFDPAGMLSPGVPNMAAFVGATQGAPVEGNNDNSIVSINDSSAEVATTGGSVQIDYDGSDYSIVSITAFQDWEQENVYSDTDATIHEFLGVNDRMNESTFSQELRIASEGNDLVDWIAGAFYYESDLNRGSQKHDQAYARTSQDFLFPDFITHALISPNLAPMMGGMLGAGDHALWEVNLSSKSLAAFLHTTWYVSDDTTVIAGIRTAKEDKDFDIHTSVYDANNVELTPESYTNYQIQAATGTPVAGAYQGGMFLPIAVGVLQNGFNAVNLEDDRSDSDFTGMISVNHKLSNDASVFATMATGAKSGGFNGTFGALTTEQRVFDQENTTNFEVGAKIDGLLDGRMRINASYFYTIYDDFQATTYDPTTSSFKVSNAGQQITEGVDFDLTYVPIDNLSLKARVQYLDARYEDFVGGNCHPTALIANGGDVPYSDPTNPKAGCDLSGKTMAFSPEWSGSLTADYIYELADSELYANVNTSFKSEHYADPTRAAYSLEEYQLWNARFGWRNDDWNVSVWAKNLTDETYSQTHAGNTVSNILSLAAPGSISNDHRRWIGNPRTIGLTVRYNFD